MGRQEIVDRLIEEEKIYGLPVLLDYLFGKNIRVRLNYSLNDCEKSIDELNLSVRSQNALKRANILKIDTLIDNLNIGNLKGIRNLGRKSYSEIQTKILVYGYERLSLEEKKVFFSSLLSNCKYSTKE